MPQAPLGLEVLVAVVKVEMARHQWLVLSTQEVVVVVERCDLLLVALLVVLVSPSLGISSSRE
jgi:hypothetical protein